MGAYARVKTALELVGDTAGGLRQILFGTIGDLEEYPIGAENEGQKQTLDTGSLWNGDLLIPVLEAVGDEIDNSNSDISGIESVIETAWVTRGKIFTSASSFAPVLSGGRNIASVNKEEATEYIEIVLDVNYANAYYFATGMLFDNALCSIPHLYAISSSAFRLRWYSSAGGVLDINNRYVHVFASGPV